VPGIGLLNEKPLHASLKAWYAQPGDRFEVPVGGFVIDIVRDDVLLEIQTGSFASIKSKLAKLLESHQIRLIHPIAQEKWIVRLTTGDRAATRRKSPNRGRVEDVFWNMVSIPQLISRHNLSLEVLMIREEEARRYAGRRIWRRKGWVIAERRLLEVVDRRLFDKPADWLALLPDGFEPFTARDLAEAMGIRLALAQKMAYSLREARLVKLIGRRGRANLYTAGAQ
jgi:ribosomal protein S25